MSDGTIVAVVFLVFSLALLALEAIAEAGVISLSRSRARLLASRAPDNPRAQRLQEITQDRERALGSIAVGRSVAVATAFTAAFYIAFSEIGEGWETIVLTGVIGAVIAALMHSIPRRLAATWPEAFALNFVRAIDLLDTAFLIPAAILEAPARLVTGLSRRYRGVAPQPTDIEVLIEHESEPLEEEERAMIRGVMTIGDRVVREAMTPRPDVAALPADTPLHKAARFTLEHGFSRVPIYTETVDHITGILYAKDLLREILKETELPIAKIAREPMFIPESTQIDELLTEFQQERVHLAIVLDEYGGTAGLITLEDLIEEIVGDIADEYDPAAAIGQLARREGDALMLDGRAPLASLEELGVHVEAADFDTVAGLVFDRLGRIPVVGDIVGIDGLSVVVEEMDGRRVAAIRAVAEHTHEADADDTSAVSP